MRSLLVSLLVSASVSAATPCKGNHTALKWESRPISLCSQINESLYSPLEQVSDISTDNNTVIIDARDNTETSDMPGLKIPLYEIKTKHYLKNKSLFILPPIGSIEAIENEITKLILNGFENVKLVTRPELSTAISYIQAKEVLLNSDHAAWLIISLDKEKLPLANTIHFDLSDHPSHKRLYALTSYYREKYPLGKIIVSAANTALYRDFYQQFYSSVSHKARYIQGGTDALKSEWSVLNSGQFGSPTLEEECQW